MRFAVTALFLLSAAGCSSGAPDEALPAPHAGDTNVASSEETPKQSSGDTASDSPRAEDPEQGSVVCPSPASACPDSCGALMGLKLDDAKQCVAAVVVGCMPPYTMVNTNAACFKRDDGVILEGSTSLVPLLGPGWSGCKTGSVGALIESAPACP